MFCRESPDCKLVRHYSSRDDLERLLSCLEDSSEEDLVDAFHDYFDTIVTDMDITEQLTEEARLSVLLATPSLIPPLAKQTMTTTPGGSDSASAASDGASTSNQSQAAPAPFKLGSECRYRVYSNVYASSRQALSKTTLAEDAERRRSRLSHFSSQQFNWSGSTSGGSVVTAQTLRSSLLHLENSLPSIAKCSNWHKRRAHWLRAVESCHTPEAFAVVLVHLVRSLRPLAFREVWRNCVGHTELYHRSLAEWEQVEALARRNGGCCGGGGNLKDRVQAEGKEFASSAPVVNYSSIPLMHHVWKLRGEEYRVFGGGWDYVSPRRQVRPAARPNRDARLARGARFDAKLSGWLEALAKRGERDKQERGYSVVHLAPEVEVAKAITKGSTSQSKSSGSSRRSSASHRSSPVSRAKLPTEVDTTPVRPAAQHEVKAARLPLAPSGLVLSSFSGVSSSSSPLSVTAVTSHLALPSAVSGISPISAVPIHTEVKPAATSTSVKIEVKPDVTSASTPVPSSSVPSSAGVTVSVSQPSQGSTVTLSSTGVVPTTVTQSSQRPIAVRAVQSFPPVSHHVKTEPPEPPVVVSSHSSSSQSASCQASTVATASSLAPPPATTVTPSDPVCPDLSAIAPIVLPHGIAQPLLPPQLTSLSPAKSTGFESLAGMTVSTPGPVMTPQVTPGKTASSKGTFPAKSAGVTSSQAALSALSSMSLSALGPCPVEAVNSIPGCVPLSRKTQKSTGLPENTADRSFLSDTSSEKIDIAHIISQLNRDRGNIDPKASTSTVLSSGCDVPSLCLTSGALREHDYHRLDVSRVPADLSGGTVTPGPSTPGCGHASPLLDVVASLINDVISGVMHVQSTDLSTADGQSIQAARNDMLPPRDVDMPSTAVATSLPETDSLLHSGAHDLVAMTTPSLSGMQGDGMDVTSQDKNCATGITGSSTGPKPLDLGMRDDSSRMTSGDDAPNLTMLDAHANTSGGLMSSAVKCGDAMDTSTSVNQTCVDVGMPPCNGEDVESALSAAVSPLSTLLAGHDASSMELDPFTDCGLDLSIFANLCHQGEPTNDQSTTSSGVDGQGKSATDQSASNEATVVGHHVDSTPDQSTTSSGVDGQGKSATDQSASNEATVVDDHVDSTPDQSTSNEATVVDSTPDLNTSSTVDGQGKSTADQSTSNEATVDGHAR